MNYALNTCEAEYAKDAKIKREDIQQLLEWASKQQHLPKISEYIWIQFYHASEYSSEKAKKLVDMHFQFKNEAQEFFTGRDFEPPRYSHSFWDLLYCFDLPNTTAEGYRIVYCGLRDYNPSKYNFEIATRMYTKVIATILLERGICPGYAVVYDLKGFSLSHLATVTISGVRKYLHITQETAEIRVKQVHIVNGLSAIDKIMMLAKPFLKKELYEMIRVHSDVSKFVESVGAEVLPVDLGGTYAYTRAELTENMKQRVNALSEVTQQVLDLKSDESLRSNSKQKGNTVNGSFKKLTID